MRRAEKAGAEIASDLIREWKRHPVNDHTLRDYLAGAIESKGPSGDLRENPYRENLLRDLGAHNLTGRALEAAYAAYDRGYRARLKEELERLQKGTS